MVMAGESATNDVDEEVYDHDGNERNEAREASAGDRRAIADADQAGQIDIKLQDHYVLLNRRQMLREWHTTRHMFHSVIGARFFVASRGRSLSAQTSCGEQDGGYSAEIPDRLHVHSNSGREQNSAMNHIRGFARSGVVISFMCARKGGYEDPTKGILRHFEAYGFLNPVIIHNATKR